jgi:hypothetical protein
VAALGGAVTLLALAACTLDKKPEPRPLTVVAVGDIACSPNDKDFNAGGGTSNACRQRATSDLVDRLDPKAVLALGDTQYQRATLENFHASYSPTWGRFKDITRPVPGNHEYQVKDAEDYYEYFGEAAGDPAKGYYSFDLGDWHLIALNSECDEVGGCGPGSPQERWLRADLAANRKQCTLAYWHQPRFSSGKTHGSNDEYDAFWRALYDFGAEIALSGHDHQYERFAPLNPEGRVDTQQGIRQFVVGTGGAELHPVGEPIEGSEVTENTTFGVLELTLLADEYRWRFLPVPGGSGFTDSGSASCH